MLKNLDDYIRKSQKQLDELNTNIGVYKRQIQEANILAKKLEKDIAKVKNRRKHILQQSEKEVKVFSPPVIRSLSSKRDERSKNRNRVVNYKYYSSSDDVVKIDDHSNIDVPMLEYTTRDHQSSDSESSDCETERFDSEVDTLSSNFLIDYP